jgi:hypothetical protein
VEKLEGRRALGRTRHRFVDNIKIGLREKGWGGMDWIDVAELRDQWKALVNTARKEPSGSIKFLEVLEYQDHWRLLQKSSAP